jgi:hypothetical protein
MHAAAQPVLSFLLTLFPQQPWWTAIPLFVAATSFAPTSLWHVLMLGGHMHGSISSF